MVLAHHSGWVNFLLVAAPVVVFAALLWLANRRAQQHLDANEAAGEAPPDRPGAAPSAPEASEQPGQPGDGGPQSLAVTSAPTDASFSQNRS
jgi:hypothetical protein